MASTKKLFWSDPLMEPKRAYRWHFSVAGLPLYVVKKVTRPSFTISETPHTYLSHNFYYPGKLEWQTVSFTLVDPVHPDAAATMYQLIVNSGYRLPKGPSVVDNFSISKKAATAALLEPTLTLLGSDANAQHTKVEQWKLHNAWIKNVEFSEMDYTSDDMAEVVIEVRYDYASNTIKGSVPVDAKAPTA